MPIDLSWISRIPGWLTNREASLLYTLAKTCSGAGVIVEIGSWKGKSTVCLAQGSMEGARVPVFAIDPFTGSSEHGAVYTFPEFATNIALSPGRELITPMKTTSEDASHGWIKPIALLWIDGAHEFAFVNLDFQLWSPHLIPGGVIAFHDSTDPGVLPVIDAEIFGGTAFRGIRFLDGVTWAVKGKPLPGENRLMGLLFHGKFFLWKIRNRFRKWRKTRSSRGSSEASLPRKSPLR